MTVNRLIMLLYISKKELTPTKTIVEYAKEIEDLIKLKLIYRRETDFYVTSEGQDFIDTILKMGELL